MRVVLPRIFGSQNAWIILAAFLSLFSFPGNSLSDEKPLSPKQYVPALEQVQKIFVQVTASSSEGKIETASLLAIITQRMKDLGYSIITQPTLVYDVKVEISCSARELPPSQGDVRSSGPGTRLFPQLSGPPCLVRYRYMEKVMVWQRIDRIVFTLGVQAAQQLQQEGNVGSPMELFQGYLEQYDFPLLLTAEWGQTERLVRFLKNPDTDPVRKKMVLSLLGEIRSNEAIPCLISFLEVEAFVQPATLALGYFGVDVRPPLVQLLRFSHRSDVKAAAAHSLGMIGATTGDWSLAPLFVEILQNPDLDIAVQIELVWAIGKSPDRLALPILEKLYNQVWSLRSQDPQLDELRKAIDWSHRSVRLGGHTDAY